MKPYFPTFSINQLALLNPWGAEHFPTCFPAQIYVQPRSLKVDLISKRSTETQDRALLASDQLKITTDDRKVFSENCRLLEKDKELY